MTEDEMIAASAAQATAFGKQAQLDRSERDAAAAGLTMKQMDDGDMNGGRSFSGGAVGGPGDVQAREFAANRQVVEARKHIIDEGEMSLDDLVAPDLASPDATTRENARSVMKANQFASHLIGQGAQQVVHNAYMNPNEASNLMEAEAHTPIQHNDGWQVKKVFAKLKSGKQLPVFIVEDTLTGMNTGKKYRIAVIAEKISAVLNATQNMDDPRINMIDAAYDQHVTLMRSLNEAKRSGNAQKAAIIETKLQVVNGKLGLS